MAKNYSYKYELASQDSNFPARTVLFDKPGQGCYIDKHWHKTIEIDYVVRGDMDVVINDELIELSGGDFSVINAGDIHMTKGKYETAQVRFVVVIFSYAFMKHYFDDFEKYRYEISDDNVKEEIKGYLDKIAKYVDSSDEIAELYVLTSLINILETLFSKCKVERKIDQVLYEDTSEFTYAMMACEYIKDHFKENLTLKSVADAVGLSPTYFARYFKTKVNKTFLVYLNDIRLANTLAEIENFDVTETEAAFNNGFPNVKSFIATFKRNYNCTPTEYVKKEHALPRVYGYKKITEKNNFVKS